MALNFPSSPTNGQKFTNGNMVYTYSTATGAWSAAPLGTALPFNYIVNPSMDISQENGDTAGSSSAYHPADQWQFFTTTAGGVVTAARVLIDGIYACRLTATVATPSLGSTISVRYIQRVEGTRIAGFKWGLATGIPAVLRFSYYGQAGTFDMCVNGGATPQQLFIARFIVPVANTWTDFVIPIPRPPTGTAWVVDTTQAMSVNFSIAVGSSWYAPAVGWNATGGTNWYGVTGGTNGIATAGLTFAIAKVGLYLDPASTGRAPPWEPTPIGQAHMDSMRFYHETVGMRGVAVSATSMGRAGIQNPVEMCKAPAYSLKTSLLAYDGTSNAAISAIAVSYANTRYKEANFTTTGLTIGRGVITNMVGGNFFVANARLG